MLDKDKNSAILQMVEKMDKRGGVEKIMIKGIVSMVPQLMARMDGASIEGLAEAIGIHRHTAAPIARGLKVPSDLDKWEKLCIYLKAKPEDILIFIDGRQIGDR